MFRSPSGRKSAGRARAARRFALVVSLFLVAATLPFINTKGAGQQQEEVQPRTKSGLVEKGEANVIAGAEFVPGEVLVRFRTDAAAKSAEAAPTSLRPEIGGDDVTFQRFEGSDIVRGLRLAKVEAARTLEAVAELASRPDVLYAEPNYIWRVERTPNDPRFGEMYGLNRINAPAAWDRTIGSRNIVVGVLDGGVDLNHPDLQANIWTNPGDPVDGNDNDGNGFVDDLHGWDFHNNNSSIFDNEAGDDHATHVAGTIGATGDNNVGVTGVNWEVSLMSLKVLGPTGGAVSKIINGYNYARTMRQRWDSSGGTQGANIRVLNNSYGGPGKSLAALDAIQQLNAAGILFVVAAGNNASDNFSFPDYPANYDAPNVISVAATTSSDGLAGFSNFGARLVSMGAPGSGILSTTPNNTYSFFSGTSMASPHVAGAAALVCAANPNITLSQLRGVLTFTGDVLPALQDKSTTGRRLNVQKAIQSAGENDTVAPAQVSDLRVASQNGRSLTLAWTAPGDDGNSNQAADYDFFFINPADQNRTPLSSSLLPGLPGSQQSGTVSVPYLSFSGQVALRTYDNAGNFSEATVAFNVGENAGSSPFIAALSAASQLSTGGAPLNLRGDDRYRENYPLPFAYPYFGTSRSNLTISTNGALYFSPPPKRDPPPSAPLEIASDLPSDTEALRGQAMIAGLWDDLRTDRAGGDVYVVQDADRIIFRWEAVTFDTPLSSNTSRGENPVKFEIELQRGGGLVIRYGAGDSAPTNTKLFPVVGVGSGEPNPYIIFSHTSESQLINLTNAQTVTFTPRPAVRRTISGQVTSGGGGLSGVTLALSGSQTATVLSAADGSYSFPNLPEGGNYIVTPSRSNYTFSPPSISFVNLSADQTSANFTGTLATYTISGRVTQSNSAPGVPLPNVTVRLEGPQTGTTMTDANGNYSFNVSVRGDYTVTPSRTNYTFSPPSQTFLNISVNQSADFLGGPQLYSIGGRVRDINGGIAGVTITLSGVPTRTVTTDAQGIYSFMGAGIAGNDYTITATKQGYAFTPPSYTLTNLSGEQTANFSTGGLITYAISGVITNASGANMAGVPVSLTGGPELNLTATDANGSYLFANVIAGGNYTVTPSGGFNSYAPPNYAFTNLSANQTAVNFTATPEPTIVQFSAASYQFNENYNGASVFVTRSGNPAGTVSVDVITVDDPASVPCSTNNGTAYARCDYATTIERVTLPAGGLTAKEIFIPLIDDAHVEQAETFQLKLLNVSNAVIGARATTAFTIVDTDFTGQPNPIFTNSFFVRLQYLDFLSREPDAAGFNAWNDVLNRCSNVNNNPACDRLTVSKSFFKSLEFQLKGFFVYRFYGLSFNRLPLYTEIVPDMRSVTGATEQEVYQKRGAFANNWVQQPAFKALYDSKTAQEFVNTLMDRYALQTITTPDPANPDGGAKLTFSRADLVNALNAATLTRAQVVRAIVESDQLTAAEYNRAYVAMQYFGYLRRDPDASGFNGWLNYLNANPTDDRTMVNGFANSVEYRLRFGQAQ